MNYPLSIFTLLASCQCFATDIPLPYETYSINLGTFKLSSNAHEVKRLTSHLSPHLIDVKPTQNKEVSISILCTEHFLACFELAIEASKFTTTDLSITSDSGINLPIPDH